MDRADTGGGFSSAKAADAAFYRAFAECDVQAMAEVWTEDEIVCIYPGAVPLIGCEAVMRSWNHMMLDAALLELTTTWLCVL